MQEAVDSHNRVKGYLTDSETLFGIMIKVYGVRYNKYLGKGSDSKALLTLCLCASDPLSL